MKKKPNGFDEHEVLHNLAHYLPAQSPLKDFVHHNTLHSFQEKRFLDALQDASAIFGYKTYLPLADFRSRYHKGQINSAILKKIITKSKGKDHINSWLQKLIGTAYDESINPRIGLLRANWKNQYGINLEKSVHSAVFRIVCSYLDQGISMWQFPVHDKGFLSSIKELEKNSYVGFFKSERAKLLLFKEDLRIQELLSILVGDETLYEQYLFDQQFSHPGWSGMVATIESQPQSLLDTRKISFADFIVLELLLEIDVLDTRFGTNWAPLANSLKETPIPLFAPIERNELFDVLSLWQQAFEWSLYNQVLSGIQKQTVHEDSEAHPSFQALFCMDDRECSLRRYVEKLDKKAATFGTPGFFHVEFFYRPINGKFYTKLCPAPVTPKYLIKEIGLGKKRETDIHYTKHSHSLVFGWLISQTLGFTSALKLFLSIFKPTMTLATSASFRHLDAEAELTIEHRTEYKLENNLQIGFTVPEMADRVIALLNSIGLVNRFAPLVYLVGHGATSVNNTHYAGYDCGACSGRPGSVNAKVMAFMANHPEVRILLRERGIHIPESTQFVAALHDTTRDDITYFDEKLIHKHNSSKHEENKIIFAKALDFNAKERSRRFDTVDSSQSLARVHEKIRNRSVSLFEPRPELNHATNAMCIVGRRNLSKQLFLDRRSFMNSYDYQIDPKGEFLYGILKAVAPVGGGINLEYYFSRVDNYKLGAGSKLPHNVMGLLGVANGIDGDLRPGLPSQMIEVHDPIRLLIIVEHFPEVVIKAITKMPETYEWFKNDWVKLVSIHPESRAIAVFENEKFEAYIPIENELGFIDDGQQLAEQYQDNLPVYLLNNN